MGFFENIKIAYFMEKQIESIITRAAELINKGITEDKVWAEIQSLVIHPKSARLLFDRAQMYVLENLELYRTIKTCASRIFFMFIQRVLKYNYFLLVIPPKYLVGFLLFMSEYYFIDAST